MNRCELTAGRLFYGSCKYRKDG